MLSETDITIERDKQLIRKILTCIKAQLLNENI